MLYIELLFPAHERFLIGRDSHGISAIYLIIYIADIPYAVGSLLYVRPLTTSYHFTFLFSIKELLRYEPSIPA